MEKSYEVFIEDIDRDEMRSGFLVTSQRKKLWNVQIGLINEAKNTTCVGSQIVEHFSARQGTKALFLGTTTLIL